MMTRTAVRRGCWVCRAASGLCLLLALAACLIAVAMTWPLVLHLGERIPKDLGDPLAQAWQVAWGGHALAHQPLTTPV